MDEIRVSVLLAVYNGTPYLREAMDSILGQSEPSLELIVVDDASTDATWQCVSDAAACDSRIIALRNDNNTGASGALNRGLAVVQGRYITRQDADDVSLPQRLAEQVAFLEAYPKVSAVGTAVRFIDTQGTVLSTSTPLLDDASLQTALLAYNCFCGPTIMARRSTLATMDFRFAEDLSTSEDYDMALRLAEVGQLANLPEPLYLYRQHSASVSQRQSASQMFKKAVALERALGRRYESHPPQQAVDLLARDYLRAAVLRMLTAQEAKAREYLDRALHVNPHILDNCSLVEDIVSRYTAANSRETSVAMTERIFNDLLPTSPHLERVRNRLLGRLHMQEVFAAIDRGEQKQATTHLWQGVRRDPSWLRNRGVLSLLIKSAMQR
jgi:glycosyltransferase involved in cell wall biosynthesis